MRYIIDIDALNDCLDLTPHYLINDKPYVSLAVVKEMINRFPKEEMGALVENLQRLGVIKT